MDAVASLDLAAWWRGATVLMLGWLAFFFGRTLLAGQMPLIERIARVGTPDLKPALQRYTRTLTFVWACYFLIAALVALSGVGQHAGPWAGVGSLLFFVGEHRLRRRLFPGEAFPGLAQQVRDTWAIRHPRLKE